MKSAAISAFAIGVVVAASAAEHHKVNPLAIYGTWIGAPGEAPSECAGDGYFISFGSVDGKKFLMTVQHRVNGIAPLDGKKTEYMAAPPPETTPSTIDVYLTNPNGDLGIHIRPGSQIEIIPPGADRAFSTPSLVLKRCS